MRIKTDAKQRVTTFNSAFKFFGKRFGHSVNNQPIELIQKLDKTSNYLLWFLIQLDSGIRMWTRLNTGTPTEGSGHQLQEDLFLLLLTLEICEVGGVPQIIVTRRVNRYFIIYFTFGLKLCIFYCKSTWMYVPLQLSSQHCKDSATLGHLHEVRSVEAELLHESLAGSREPKTVRANHFSS